MARVIRIYQKGAYFMVKVYTAQIWAAKSKSVQGAIDITVKSSDDLGKFFAPTWSMVVNYKNNRISTGEYIKEYIKLLHDRYNKDKESWRKILSMDKVVLCCYCKGIEIPDPMNCYTLDHFMSDSHNNIILRDAFCHRYILAYILTRMGAEYKGEIKRGGTIS